MPTNLYTPYANGTFEGSTGVLLKVYDHFRTSPGSWSPVQQDQFAFSNEQARGGARSFKWIAPNDIFHSEDHDYQYSEPFIAGVNLALGTPNKIALDPSKKYRVGCWVYVPSGSPVATPGALIGLFDHQLLLGLFGRDVLYETLMDGRIRAYRDLDNPTEPANWPFFEFTLAPVSVATDQWVRVEAIVGGSAALQIVSLGLTIWGWKFNYRSGYGDGPWVLDLTEGGTVVNQVFADGQVFVDDFDVYEVQACDLTGGTPSYTKANETVAGANDGVIVANFTSSFTMEFSLDGVTWQLSPTFTALAPDTYTLWVRDSFGCTAQVEDIIIGAGGTPPDPPDPPAPGPIQVDQNSLVQYNFIHWFNAVGPVVDFTSIICSNRQWGIAKGYNVKDSTCPMFFPIAVPGESFSFYASLITPSTDPQFPDWRLGLMDGAELVATEIGVLERHNVFDTGGGIIGYNFYCTSVTVPPGTRQGRYTMVIYNNVTGGVVMVSNQIEVMTAANAAKLSTLHWFRHNQIVYKYYWTSLPDNWLYKIRLRLYRVDEQTEGNLTQYRSVTTGSLRNVSFELDKAIKLESYFFNDAGHDAMDVWQMFLVTYINQKPYVIKSIYKRDGFDPAYDCYKGSIEMYDQEFSTANHYASSGPITVIPTFDPLLLGNGADQFIKI